MSIFTHAPALVLLGLFGVTALHAQPTQPTTPTLTAVPRLVRVNSYFHPANGTAPSAMESVTLAIYPEEVGGTALWQETQNVSVDGDGHYSVLLGATRNEGLPLELFASKEPRWLGVQLQRTGEAEQPRVMLASVPYALQAADADTLGGRPASAYVLADPAAGSNEGGVPITGVEGANAAVPRATTGTAGAIAKFVNTTDLGNSVMFENTGKVGVGTVSPLDYFHVALTDTSGGFTGYAVQNLGSGASSYSGMLFYDQNGALGQFQGFNNSTHEYRINNVAANGSINFMLGGSSKFRVRPDGDVDLAGNIRKGGALFLNNLGFYSTGVGLNALGVNANSYNNAVGYAALYSNTTGYSNNALGEAALGANVTGYGNTAMGHAALFHSTGNYNTALGYLAGSNLTTGSNNIMIGHVGFDADDSVIRIGNVQTQTFIAGISGVATSLPADYVVIDPNGQMGTMNSSRRYKEDIADMGSASSALQLLRPVTFRYKKPMADGSKPLDYGLIAEEVAEVYPDLVVRDATGRIQTVQYHKLTPMMLNELQKEHQQATLRDETIDSQKEVIRLQDERIRALEARLAELETLLSVKLAMAATPGH